MSLLAILGTAPWLPEAACRGLGVTFDSRQPDETDAEVAYRYRAAVDLCRQCRELTACLAWLHALSPDQRPAGTVAGHLVDWRGRIEPPGASTDKAAESA